MLVDSPRRHPLQVEVLTDCASFTDVLCREISAQASPISIHVRPSPAPDSPLSADAADLVVAQDPETPDLRDALAGWLSDRRPHIPYVILLSQDREGDVDEWMQRGASDYVLMEHPARLRAVVANALHHYQTERLLREQSAIMEQIARGIPLQTVLDELTAMAERICPDMACSILLLSPDRRHLLHGSGPSLPAEYSQAIDRIEIGPMVGSCGTAAYYKKQVIVEDIASDPLWSDYRELALKHGLRACWSTPILDAEKEVLGTFALYYSEARRPRPFHLRLIEAATHAAEIAIGRSRTEQRLLDTTRGLQAVVEAADELLRCTTLDQVYRRCVELGRERLGLERCGLYLRVGDQLLGTYGTDGQGHTTNEFRARVPLKKRYPDPDISGGSRWVTREERYTYWSEQGELVELGTVGWIASTPLFGSNKELHGVFNNDNALTQTPLSKVQQEVVSVYCSLVATILESMTRDAERQQMQRRFEQLARTIHEVFCITNRTGTEFLYVSPAIQSMWGVSPEDLYADPSLWLRRVHPDDRSRVESALQGVDGDRCDLVYRLELPDGKQRWIRDRRFPVYDDRNEIYRISGIAEDITTRKQTEDNEKALQAKLIRAERMESLGLLAGGVAHDLNNILGPVVGYPELLLMDLPDDSPMRDSVISIRDSAQRAAEVIRDLLTLARRGVKNQTAVVVTDIIDEFFDSPVYRNIRKQFPQVALVQELTSDRCAVTSTAHHLSQVIMNLVMNACEAMPESGRIWIRSHRVTTAEPRGRELQIPPGDYVLLQVQDEGEGMGEEDLEHLFEPFYTRKVLGRSGSGLGLSIVYGVVQDAEGFMDVQSQPGEGTTFSLYLPINTQLVKAPSSTPDPRGGPETILVVDDVSEQRALVSRILTKLGYTVHLSATGHQAVSWLKNHSADLVILDMIMEDGFDGLDAFLEIRKIRPRQPCLLATGFAETERVKQAQRLGAGPCIRKPYTLGQLSAAIRDQLQAER